MIRAAVLFSAFLSAFSACAYLCDLLFGRLFFHAIFALSVALTAACGGRWRPGKADSGRARFLPAALGVATGVYLLLPTPSLFPLSMDWDGAHHVAIANQLALHGSHAQLEAEAYALSWGDELFSYPWGMHAVVAYLSVLTGANAFAVVFPFVALVLALVVGSLAAYLQRKGASPFAVLLCSALLLLSKYTLFFLIQFDYWSQAVGLLLLLSVLYLADTGRDPERRRLLLPALVLGGTALVYPLFTPVAFVGFALHAVLSGAPRLPRLSAILALAAGLSALYAFAYVGENVARIGHTGPSFLADLGDPSTWMVIVLHALAIPLLPGLVRRRSHAFLAFPLAGAGLVLLLFSVSALGLLTVLPGYWTGKLLATNLVLLLPVVALHATALETVLARRLSARPARVAALGVCFALALAAAPRRPLWRLTPALSRDEYAMRLWTVGNLDRPVRYAASPYKIAWYEAIADTPRIEVPPDFRAQAIALKRRYRPGPGTAARLASGLPRGSLVIADTTRLELSAAHFRQVERFGSVILYERK